MNREFFTLAVPAKSEKNKVGIIRSFEVSRENEELYKQKLQLKQ